MKQNKMLLMRVVFIILSFFPYSIGNAKEKTDKWILYGTFDTGDYYYDKSSIKNVNNRIITLTNKVKYSNIGKNKVIQLRKNNKLSIDGWGKLDYLIQIYELNLVNNTMRVTKSVDYNYEGKILLDFNSRNPEIIKILPGSMGELLQKEVCPK